MILCFTRRAACQDDTALARPHLTVSCLPATAVLPSMRQVVRPHVPHRVSTMSSTAVLLEHTTILSVSSCEDLQSTPMFVAPL